MSRGKALRQPSVQVPVALDQDEAVFRDTGPQQRPGHRPGAGSELDHAHAVPIAAPHRPRHVAGERRCAGGDGAHLARVREPSAGGTGRARRPGGGPPRDRRPGRNRSPHPRRGQGREERRPPRRKHTEAAPGRRGLRRRRRETCAGPPASRIPRRRERGRLAPADWRSRAHGAHRRPVRIAPGRVRRPVRRHESFQGGMGSEPRHTGAKDTRMRRNVPPHHGDHRPWPTSWTRATGSPT